MPTAYEHQCTIKLLRHLGKCHDRLNEKRRSNSHIIFQGLVHSQISTKSAQIMGENIDSGYKSNKRWYEAETISFYHVNNYPSVRP